MKPNYRLKRTVPHRFIILTPGQYKIKGGAGNVLKVWVKQSGISMSFWLAKSGKYYINGGRGKGARRKDAEGNLVTYAIPVGEVV